MVSLSCIVGRLRPFHTARTHPKRPSCVGLVDCERECVPTEWGSGGAPGNASITQYCGRYLFVHIKYSFSGDWILILIAWFANQLEACGSEEFTVGSSIFSKKAWRSIYFEDQLATVLAGLLIIIIIIDQSIIKYFDGLDMDRVTIIIHNVIASGYQAIYVRIMINSVELDRNRKYCGPIIPGVESYCGAIVIDECHTVVLKMQDFQGIIITIYGE